MERYDSYKDSGVEWIGEIPSHWNTIKTYLITENLDGKRVPLNSEERSDIQGEIPYWGSGGIVDYINKYIFDEELLLVGEDGSPFFDSYRDVSFYVNEKIWVNNHIHILRSKKDIVDTKFLVNSFNTVDYKEYISGSTRDKLTQSDLNRIIHPIPPLSEQSQIVQFLDEKTSLIDSLIEKTKRKIELLKEERTSLINHTVTKGLNPNVEMKDSGVEWIGEIPSHWIPTPLKRVVFIGNGKDYKHIEIEEGGYPVYGTGGEFSRCSDYLHIGPSVLLGRKGTINNPLYIEEPFWTSDTIYYTVINEDKIIPKLLFHLVHQIPFSLFSYGSAIPSMSKSHYEEMRFPIPPLSEQSQIVSYLDEHTQLIDKTISIEEKRIELLREYRQSLISEVVTGKIKVVN